MPGGFKQGWTEMVRIKAKVKGSKANMKHQQAALLP
jgi:hypothetical protein